MTVTAAILLAGARVPAFDDAVALLPFGDGTLVEYQVEQLRAAGVDVIEVVRGHEVERIIPLVGLDNVEPIVDVRWAESPASALRVGATAVPRDSVRAIVVSVAAPRTAADYRRLLDAHRDGNAPIAALAGDDAPSAPVVVSREVLAEIRNLRDDALGLGPIVERHDLRAVAGGSGVAVSITSPDTYARALRAFGFTE
jgi:CTP:molybdopterin cytidylyltransferase MocA